MLDQQTVGATRLNVFKKGLQNYDGHGWASSWIDRLNPRPLWLESPASEATQRELQGEFT